MSCKQKCKCKCKCKCKKQPVLVVKYAQDDFEDFLKELNQGVRDLYDFEPQDYDPILDWVDLVQKRLICMRKKYCKKPHLVSGIFNTDLEMELARISDCFCTIYSSSSSNRTVDPMFRRRKKLIVDTDKSGRPIFADNRIYDDYDREYIRYVNGCDPDDPDYSYSSEITINQPEKQIARRGDLEILDNVLLLTANGVNLDQIRDQVMADNACADIVEQGYTVRFGGDDAVEILDKNTGQQVMAKLATQNTTLGPFLKTAGLGVGEDSVLFERRLTNSGYSCNKYLRW